MTINVYCQDTTGLITIPKFSDMQKWVALAIDTRLQSADLTVRIVGEAESATLNQQYRHKIGPTNVLSFRYETPPGVLNCLFGDIVICAPIIETEAREQQKTTLAHWAHMVIHGTLHLLGFEHETAAQAQEMENLETKLLIELGFSAPYGELNRL
jgi:probable rRNA maturation factor